MFKMDGILGFISLQCLRWFNYWQWRRNCDSMFNDEWCNPVVSETQSSTDRRSQKNLCQVIVFTQNWFLFNTIIWWIMFFFPYFNISTLRQTWKDLCKCSIVRLLRTLSFSVFYSQIGIFTFDWICLISRNEVLSHWPAGNIFAMNLCATFWILLDFLENAKRVLKHYPIDPWCRVEKLLRRGLEQINLPTQQQH